MFMFELAVLHTIFNMATSNINKMSIYNKNTKPHVATAFKKKTCLIKQFYRHCSVTAIFFKKLNFISPVSCNSEITLKLTFQFSVKGTFN